MWYDDNAPSRSELAAEAAEEQEWHDYNANRVMRDLQFEEWCAVHGYDPEDAASAYAYELDTVATCGSMVSEGFWAERGFVV